MATLDHISGAEPSTITFKVRTATYTQNSSKMHAEVLVLGDPESTIALAAVLGAAPASTTFGLIVRRVGDSTSIIKGDSTVFQGTSPWTVAGNCTVAPLAGSTWNTRTLQSSAADLQMTATPAAGSTWNVRALQSSAADFQATVTPVAGSTWNVRALQSSAADLQTTVTPNSTVWQVQVHGDSTSFQGTSPWVISGNCTVAPLAGSTWAVRPIQSSAADLQMTATPVAGSTWNVRPIQSSAADLQMTATPLAGSTWNVRALQSSAADFQATVTPAAGSTWAVRPIQSSQADLRITAYQSSAAEFLATVTIGANLQSTTAPSSNSSGLVVRQVVDNLLTTASTSAFASTVLTIQSSGAGLRSYVTAYSITTTNAGPSKISFYSSGVVLWPILLAAVSSAVSGVNLAVAPPGYLFRTIGAADALTLNLGGGASTIGGWRVGVSYFRAP